MTDYSQNTSFTAKDALSTGDAAKIVSGAEIDAEFSEISTAITSKSNKASPTFTGIVNLTGAVLSGAIPLTFEGSTDDVYETQFLITDPTIDRAITFPDLTGTVMLRNATETMSNKTMDLGLNTLTGSLAEFNTALQGSTFCTLTGAETLTSKTITGGSIDGIAVANLVAKNAVETISGDWTFTGVTVLPEVTYLPSATTGNYLESAMELVQGVESYGSYTLVGKFKVGRAGTYNTRIYLYNDDSGFTTYGRLYKNGVAEGTARSQSGTAGSGYWNETVTVVKGDTLELWAYGNGGSGSDVKMAIMTGNPHAGVGLDYTSTPLWS